MSRKYILTFLIFGITLLGIYLINAEKFLPEYWLQRRIDKLRIERLENVSLSENRLTYSFYYNTKIDIEVSIYSNGILSISRNKRNKGEILKTTYFETDSVKTTQLITEFKTEYIKSEFKAVDDHLSSNYSVLHLNNNGQADEIKIEFYNVVPGKKFKTMKNKILDLTKKELDGIMK